MMSMPCLHVHMYSNLNAGAPRFEREEREQSASENEGGEREERGTEEMEVRTHLKFLLALLCLSIVRNQL